MTRQAGLLSGIILITVPTIQYGGYFRRRIFFSMPPRTAGQPSEAVSLIYVGAIILALVVLTLAIGLIRISA
jgi:hypothetical protein